MRKFYSFKNTIRLAILCIGGFASSQVINLGPGYNASDVSDDGTVVTLSTNEANYMWTEAGGVVMINSLSNGYPNAGRPTISGDGTKITATATNPDNNYNEIGLYDVATSTWTYLGGIGGPIDGSISSSWAMTSDGTSIVGLGWLPPGNNANAHAIQWKESTGMVDLGSTVEGSSCRANDVSNDGTKVVGWQANSSGFWQGAIWANGVQTLIQDQDGNPAGEAGAISGDGNWIIGYNGFNPYIWSETTGFQIIEHDQAGVFFRGGATDVSEDGSVVIGYFRPWPGAPFGGEGFIWTEETGRVNLNEYVESLDIDTQGITFSLPLGISADGKYIVGTGTLGGFNQVSFLIKLPDTNPPCDAVDVPYIQDFETAIAPAMPECTTTENAGTGSDWVTNTGTEYGFTGTHLRYRYNSTNAANAWFYTQGINLSASKSYKITYDYGGTSTIYSEKLKVAYGTSATSTGMSTVLADHPEVVNNTPLTNTVEFTPAADAVYYFGFNAYSDPDKFYLFVDNIKVEEIEGSSGGDELLVIDLTTPNQFTITATDGTSGATVEGPTLTGFYLAGFFGEAGEQEIGNTTFVGTPTISPASVPTDNTPSIFRGITDDDPGLNVYGYSGTSTTTFTAGELAFTGDATWEITPELYAAMLNAPETGDVYFPADGVGELSGDAIKIGTYKVILPGTNPGEPCEQEFAGEANTGAGFSEAYLSANDIDVSAGGTFELAKFSMNYVVSTGNPSTIDLKIMNDDAGKPGTEELGSFAALAPITVTPAGSLFDFYPMYIAEFELPTPVELTEGKYWIVVHGAYTSNGGFPYWGGYDHDASNTLPMMQSADNGVNWTAYVNADSGVNSEGIMTVEGLCTGMDASDMDVYQFSYYPNPVKDVLNINSQKEVQNISVHNMAGQTVMQNLRSNKGQVNMSSLSPGVYVFRVTLQGGQVETFKVIKK